MEITRKGQTVHMERYALVFEWNDMSGAGFSFYSDERGVVDRSALHPCAIEELNRCLSGEYNVTCLGVQDYSYDYWEPPQGRCSCGKLIDLYHPMTNTCMCGREYNGSGQLLAPRSQWEEV